MASKGKIYKIKCNDDRRGTTEIEGTLEYLVKDYFGYTLEVGASWQHEKRNRQINCNPKSIKALITNLNNAVNNAAPNGYAGKYYYYLD